MKVSYKYLDIFIFTFVIIGMIFEFDIYYFKLVKDNFG